MPHAPRKSACQPSVAELPAHPADERRRALVRLVPLWPAEIDDVSLQGRQRLVSLLERALMAERRRGRAGHWAYDLARHGALLATWRRESAALEDLKRAGSPASHEKGCRPHGQHPQ
ncbi:hypothetical protein [Hyphomicrobium sp.]|uniref:hypothetical protein n=1 Tax=Hyphomicrobium sp. TaxID=82 RepID=UPI003F6F4D8B